ncbi:MAG: type II secretion system protein GspM [Pseudomonadota bacterium]
MTAKEKKLLKIMLLIVTLGIMFKGIPFAYESYQQRKNDIKELKDKKQRLKNLIDQVGTWKIAYDQSLKQKKLLEKELFTASSNELVAAKVQLVIKNLARQSNVRVESMHLAEFQESDNWLLVSLSVTIKADAANVIKLLNKIRANKQKLLIKEISIRSYLNNLRNSQRNTLNGSITLVGFSKSITQQSAEKERD